MKKTVKRIIIGVLIFFICTIAALVIYYKSSLSPVSKEHQNITFTIENGESTKKILANLK